MSVLWRLKRGMEALRPRNEAESFLRDELSARLPSGG